MSGIISAIPSITSARDGVRRCCAAGLRAHHHDAWLHADRKHRWNRRRCRRPPLRQPFADHVGIDAVAQRYPRHRGSGLQALGRDIALEFKREGVPLPRSLLCRHRHSIIGVRLFHGGRHLSAARSTLQGGIRRTITFVDGWPYQRSFSVSVNTIDCTDHPQPLWRKYGESRSAGHAQVAAFELKRVSLDYANTSPGKLLAHCGLVGQNR